MEKPKDGDIYRWSWNDRTEESMHTETLYHCCSQICIFSDGVFRDTYSSMYAKRFSIEDASKKIDLEFIANRDDLTEAKKKDRAYYDDKDFIDISHESDPRSGCYIRKGAERSLEKMRKVMLRCLKVANRAAEDARSRANDLEKEIAALTTDSHIWLEKDVYLFDESHEDLM